MRLKSVSIKNFKCIKDSDEFSIDPKVTCLVGKNESGKTAILQAIAKINAARPQDAILDEANDYPRHEWNEYQERGAGRTARFLSTTWELEDGDYEAVEGDVGPSIRATKEITFLRLYGQEHLTYALDLEENPIVDHLIAAAQLEEHEKVKLSGATSVSDLQTGLEHVEEPSKRIQDLAETVKRLGAGDCKQFIANALVKRLPKLAYFSEYLRMPGQVALNDIKQRQQSKHLRDDDEIFLDLLALVGRTLEDLEKLKTYEELKAQLEAASNRISKEIFKYWTQNRSLKVHFNFDQGMPSDPAPFNSGWVLRTRIENQRHGATTRFDQRSAGFVWFFSFLIWFRQIKKKFGEDIIILLDEPGLSLHASAQADLLRYIENELAPHHQVIYTTHSPFMIDAANVLRARTVEDVVAKIDDEEIELGTKVGDQVLSTDKATLFPLQACLGYDITQTLFVGKNALLVEGPSEILYFEWFDRKLRAAKRTGLDKRWTITPCGGVGSIMSFLSLFAGQKLNIAVVTDYAKGSKGEVERLRKRDILKSGRVFTMDIYTGQAEADVEDLLGREMYRDLVNSAYSLSDSNAVAAAAPANAPARVVVEVQNHWDGLPASFDAFDHYRPAEYLTKQTTAISPTGLGVALDRFEKLFTDLNRLLE